MRYEVAVVGCAFTSASPSLFVTSGDRPTSPDSDPNHNDDEGLMDENGQVSLHFHYFVASLSGKLFSVL